MDILQSIAYEDSDNINNNNIENRNTVCVFVWYARDKLTRCAACQFHIDIDCSICRNFSLWQNDISVVMMLCSISISLYSVCVLYMRVWLWWRPEFHCILCHSDIYLTASWGLQLKKKHIKQQRIRNGRNDDDDNILVIRNWNAHVWLCSIPENILRFQISHFHSISFVGISTYQT